MAASTRFILGFLLWTSAGVTAQDETDEDYYDYYPHEYDYGTVEPADHIYDHTVKGTVSVDSVSVSSESCNFTVSCSTELSSISRSFTCDRLTCEELDHARSGPAPSLHLYLSGMSIVCNHSNHINWRNDTKAIQEVCPIFGAKDPQVFTRQTECDVRGCVVKIAVFSVGLLLMASAIVTVHVLECVRKKRNSATAVTRVNHRGEAINANIYQMHNFLQH